MTAAATAISRARAGSNGVDRVGGLDEDPVGLRADPRLTSMCPRSRAMSLSSSGSVAAVTRGGEQGLRLAGLPARPRAAGCRERQRGTLGRVGRQSAAARS